MDLIKASDSLADVSQWLLCLQDHGCYCDI